MTGKQESLQDYFLMAKEIARQEKSLGIEHWDGISIEREGDKAGEYVGLYHYDLPRQLAEKYDCAYKDKCPIFAKTVAKQQHTPVQLQINF